MTAINPIRKASAATLALALALAAAGCGARRGPDYSVLRMAQVSGLVTLDGQPLAGARVEFVEVQRVPPRLCFGETGADGRYELYRDRDVPGCLHGEMLVRITGAYVSEEDSPGSRSAENVPAQYNRKSELRRTVEPDGRHTFDFELASR